MRAALIGTGMVADMHVEAIGNSDQVTLAGVWSRDPGKAGAFAARHGARAYGTLDDLAADKTLDFAVVTTPPDARLDITQTLASAGLPILMEKPLERTATAARALVDLCEGAGLPLGVVLQHRLRPVSVALKQKIANGALGQIAHVDVRVPWWRPQSYYDVAGRGTYGRDGGGVLLTQAIHSLDLMLDLAGPVSRVSAMLTTTPLHGMEAEDTATAGFHFASGASGSLMATTAAFPGASEEIAIFGTLGAARLGPGQAVLSYMDGREETLGAAPAGSGGGADPMAFSSDWHRRVIEDFAASISEGRPPLISGRSALAVHDLIAAMERASASGCHVDLEGAV